MPRTFIMELDEEIEEKKTYSQRLKGILIDTAKGFGVGLLTGVFFAVVFGRFVYKGTVLECSLMGAAFFVGLGLIVTIILAAKDNSAVFIAEGLSHLLVGFQAAFFGVFDGGNLILIMFGIIRYIIGFIILIPVGIWLAVSYVLHLIYLIIMTILEKTRVIEGKDRLCRFLDVAVQIVAAGVTLFICAIIIKSMMNKNS